MKYAPSFKLWHWLNAFVVLGLLGTVFLRKTFLSWKTNSEILMNKLAELDIVISLEQAKELAIAIRSSMWEWHIFLGYALATLLIYRVVLFFIGATKKKSFIRMSPHKKGVEIMYYLFYGALFFMATSGMLMVYYEELSFSKELRSDIKEVHELVFNFILFFTLIHTVGIVAAELGKEKGIISNMISTRKNN